MSMIVQNHRGSSLGFRERSKSFVRSGATIALAGCLSLSLLPAFSSVAFAAEEDSTNTETIAVEGQAAPEVAATQEEESVNTEESANTDVPTLTDGVEVTDEAMAEEEVTGQETHLQAGEGTVAAGATVNGGTLVYNRSVTRSVSANNPVRYTISSTTNCAIRIKGTATYALTLTLFSSNGERLLNNTYHTNQVTSEATYDRTYYLNTGTYYITFVAVRVAVNV